MPFDRRQVRLILIVLALATAALTALYLAVFRVPWVPAYQNIRESDASAIVAALDAAGVPYRLDNQGHDVLVPEDRAAEARVAVAGADVAMGGTVGFELFNDSDMGLTEFAQKINLQRALQGELARTIMDMDGVAFARVHLALPERSIFRAEQGAPTAAVAVQMKPGRPLSPQRIEGIRQLVASSVPQLQAQAVAILDADGQLVSGAPTAGSGPDAPLTERAALEQYYEARARDAIAAALPELRFQVSVSARSPVTVAPTPEDAISAVPSPDAGPARDGMSLGVLIRTRAEPEAAERDRIEAALTDSLGLDRGRGDSLQFALGWVEAPPAAIPVVADPASGATPSSTEDLPSPLSWDWLFSRWTLVVLALAGIAALILRPRRQLEDAEAASFAALLKGQLAEREPADAG